MSAGVITTEQPPESIGWVEKTARLVAKNGPEIEKTIMFLNMGNKMFSFLRSSDSSHALYQQKLTEYRAQNQGGGSQDIQPDAPATHERLGDAQSYLEPPPLDELRDCAFIIPEVISLKELGVMKLTAQFVARYGMHFRRHLMERVVKSPHFDFMKPTNRSFRFYNALVVSYSGVLIPSNGASTASLLDRFFHCLQLEKLEEGVATVMLDLHAFVGGVDCFAHMDDADYSATMPPPEPLSIMMQPQLVSQLTKHGARNQYGAQDIQPDPSATRECVGDAETDLGPPPSKEPQDSALLFPVALIELGIIKLTAQFVARYGMHFRRALMMRVVMNPQFEFLFFSPSLRKRAVMMNPQMNPPFEFVESTEMRFNIFNVLVDAYSRVLMPSKKLRKDDACTRAVLKVYFKRLQLERLEEGVEMAVIDLHAFVGGVDCFACMDDADYSATMPPPERLSAMMNRLPEMQPVMLLQLPLGSQFTKDGVRKQYECVGDSLRDPTLRSLTFRFPARGITLNELGIIKLTAQFVARYGLSFWCDLMTRVHTNPSFEFLNPSDSRFEFYSGLFAAYSKVLKPSKKLKKFDTCTTTVLNGFFHCLQLGKLQKGVKTAMIDLHAFVVGVDCLAHVEDIDYSAIVAPPERPSMMINQLPHIQAPLGSRLTEYRAQNQGGTQDIKPDAEATPECDGDAWIDLEYLHSREHRIRRSYQFPYAFGGWITFMELVIMKFTALFVARYGMHFCRDLMKEVGMKPQFKFMEPTNSKFSLYNVVVDAYSRVLEPSYDACTKTVLDDFFCRLRLEKLGEEETIIDLHAFVSGVEYFADMEDVDYSALMPAPELLSVVMNQIPSMSMRLPLELQTDYYGQFADPSIGMMQTAGPEEPEAKRQKFDESALVPEDQFLAQNPGPSRIMVVVAGEAFEMRVQSLSEKVASLKKKIAREFRIPATKQRLSGKPGVLKDNRSLAHYNVGAGEILTISW